MKLFKKIGNKIQKSCLLFLSPLRMILLHFSNKNIFSLINFQEKEAHYNFSSIEKITSLEYYSKTHLLISGSETGMLYIHDLLSGKMIVSQNLDSLPIKKLVFLEDEVHLAALTSNNIFLIDFCELKSPFRRLNERFLIKSRAFPRDAEIFTD